MGWRFLRETDLPLYILTLSIALYRNRESILGDFSLIAKSLLKGNRIMVLVKEFQKSIYLSYVLHKISSSKESRLAEFAADF